MSTYDPASYEERRARNDRSKRHAHRNGEPWSEPDDAHLRQKWIAYPAETRDEVGVALALGRTIEACRLRAHVLLWGPAGTESGTRYARPRVVVTVSWSADDDEEFPEELGYVRQTEGGERA